MDETYIGQGLYDLTRAKYRKANPQRMVPGLPQYATRLSPLVTAKDLKHVKINKFNMPGRRLRKGRKGMQQGLLRSTLLKCTLDTLKVGADYYDDDMDSSSVFQIPVVKSVIVVGAAVGAAMMLMRSRLF